jgi:molybdopterin-guanine dinucleotide biosynthesis protein A
MIALILTGGKSRRMGRDKLRIVRPDGMLQIEWLVKLLREAGLEVLLSSPGDSAPPIDLPVVTDLRPDGGPLAALEAFHSLHHGKPLLLLGGDLFLMDAVTVTGLIEGRDETRSATCYANRIDGRPEPLCTIYEAQSSALATEWLARGEHGARHFLAGLDPKILSLRSPAALDNVNNPRDLHEAFQKLREGVVAKRVTVEHPLFAGEVTTLACTVGGLFEELSFRERWDEAAAGEVPAEWEAPVREGDRIVFPGLTAGPIPPLLPPP